ncbi:MAG: class I SAM-dependent methyltransferase [Salinivirgaceae bacterium]
MSEFWNRRYSEPHYAYGEEPNAWFREQIDFLKPGKILLPGDGEGRNGVYAATKGWEVEAFDLSQSGKEKALLLAEQQGVQINFQVEDLAHLEFPENYFDAVALIYTHFQPGLRTVFHRKLADYLKVGGVLFIEGFAKDQIHRVSETNAGGGPKNVDMLYSLDELRSDFSNFDVRLAVEKSVHLDEGLFHVGESDVVRFVAIKI